MAQKMTVQLIDDLDGKSIEPGEGETITFGLDGVTYEIDLSKDNATRFRDSLAAFVNAGRRVGGGRSGGTRSRRSSSSSSGDVDPKAVREWAKANNIELSARGRIPADVVQKFKDAGN